MFLKVINIKLGNIVNGIINKKNRTKQLNEKKKNISDDSKQAVLNLKFCHSK